MNQWRSYVGFIWAVIGAAIGLGQIWKLPYTIGTSGGGAFLMIYLVATLLLGLPVLLAEMLVGRLMPGSVPSALQRLAQRHQLLPHWVGLGWLGQLTLFIILSFYTVAAGWSCVYLYDVCCGEQVIDAARWARLMASPAEQMIGHGVFLLGVLAVLSLGVAQGIERVCFWVMPAVVGLFALLWWQGVVAGGWPATRRFLLVPQWADVTWAVVWSAVGHAFFTLAVGAGCMQLYGAYLPPRHRLGPSVLIIVALNWLIAVLIACAVFSVVFAYDLSPGSGPGLVFMVVPQALSHLPAGSLWLALFFFMMCLAAWTSAMSLAEPWVMLLQQRHRCTRGRAALLLAVGVWPLSAAAMASLSHEAWSWGTRTLFAWLTDVTTYALLPLGVVGYAVLVGWSLPSKALAGQIDIEGGGWRLWRHLLRYWVPGSLVGFWLYHGWH